MQPKTHLHFCLDRPQHFVRKWCTIVSLLLSGCTFYNPKNPEIDADIIILERIEKEPHKAHTLCAKLMNPDSQKRCQSIALRPHLWSNPPARKATKREAQGPPSRQLLPNLQRPLSRIKASALPCTSSQTQATCYEQRAVSKKTAAEAIAECNNLPADGTVNWQQECLFMTAEKWVQNDGKNYNRASQLCLRTGNYQSNCFQHLSMHLAEAIPSAINTDPSDWEMIKKNAQSIRATWQPQDASFGQAMEALMWAKALDASYVKAGIVAGNPIDYLPQEALPHVRAAAVFHLMYMEGAQSFALEEWGHRSKRALQARLQPQDKRPPYPFKRSRSPNNWDIDTANDGKIPATYYMTDGRRTTTSEVHIDLLICTLEAAARLPNGKPLLQEGLSHQHQLVQWTANRLLQKN